MPIPNLYIYNPTCDMAVENTTNSYMPPESLRVFERDISPLMSFLGSGSDQIVCDRPLSDLIKFWATLGFVLPKPLKKEEAISSEHYNNITPWGWSQLITKSYNRLKDANQYWPDFFNSDTKQLFSRLTSYELLKQLAKQVAPKNGFIQTAVVPQQITQLEEAEKMLAQYPQGIILKTLWSSSGRGLVFIRNNKELSATTNWLKSKIKQHQFVLAEPIFNKVQDASLQFTIDSNGRYNFLGINYFDADAQGRFNKEYFHTPNHLKNLLPPNDDWLNEAAAMIIDSMKAIHLHTKYQGPIGVDALFFRTKSGVLKFYPLIEANLRCNMGLINLALKKRIHPKAQGTWKIETFKPTEARRFYKDQIRKNPVVLKYGLIHKGFIPLSSFDEDQQFAAWGLIS